MNQWYEESFGQDYLKVYKHRDFQGALSEVMKMIQWLGLEKGACIFDLCCGMGRHAMALADHGYQVTGMDLSSVLLQEAVQLDTAHRMEWLQGDMRHIPHEGNFDAVVNLFTSFGYFEDDQENAQVLHEIGRILKPDGKFIIDFLNPSYVKANLVSDSQRLEGELLILEHRLIVDGYVRKQIVISEPGQPDRHYAEQVKLYQLPDFQRLLKGTDLIIEQVYGSYDGLPYNEKSSPRLILLGSKQGSVPDGGH